MRINIGSKNPTKINGVKQALALYPGLFLGFQLEGVGSKAEEFGHPKNIEQVMQGAVDRAKAAFKDCNYSFGLESGLIEAPHSKSGYMEVSVCALYDGKNIYTGFGPAFEWPKKVLGLVLKGQSDASAAFKKLGFTENEKLGAAPGGIISYLTKGRLTREEQIKQSVIMALVQLENKELYEYDK